MPKFFRTSALCLVCSLFGLVSTNASATVAEKDPAAWYKEDSTPKDQYETAKKEASAAYRDALNGCRELRGAEKTACAKEAKVTYVQDLSDAKKLLGKS